MHKPQLVWPTSRNLIISPRFIECKCAFRDESGSGCRIIRLRQCTLCDVSIAASSVELSLNWYGACLACVKSFLSGVVSFHLHHTDGKMCNSRRSRTLACGRKRKACTRRSGGPLNQLSAIHWNQAQDLQWLPLAGGPVVLAGLPRCLVN